MYCCRYSIYHIYYVKFIQRTYLPILYILHLHWIQYMWHILSIFYQNPHIRYNIYIYIYIQSIYIYIYICQIYVYIYILHIFYLYLTYYTYVYIYIYTPHIHSVQQSAWLLRKPPLPCHRGGEPSGWGGGGVGVPAHIYIICCLQFEM